VLTTVAAFFPLSLIEGEMGQIFSQFSIVVVICLLFSMVESKLILPAHLSNLNTQTTHLAERSSKSNLLVKGWRAAQRNANALLTQFSQRIYQPLLRAALAKRYAALCLFVAVLVLVVGMLPSAKVRAVFFPDVPGDVISVDITLQEQAGFDLTRRHAMALESAAHTVNQQWMQDFDLASPVIKNIHTEITGDHTARVTAELSAREDRPVTTVQVSDRWRDTVGSLEAIDNIEFVSSWVGTQDLRIELLSSDSEQLSQAAAALKQALFAVQGVRDIDDNLNPGQPRLNLTLTVQGRAMALTLSDLAEQLQQAYFGFEVQRFQRGKDEVKVQVRYPQSERTDIADLLKSQIRTPQGQVLPLSLVASIESGYVVASVDRLNGQRAAVIAADVDKSVTSPRAVLEQLQQHVFTALYRDYPSLKITLGGEAQQDAETSASLVNMFGLSLLLIYVLLAVPLKSYGQPLLIMAVIPFGIVGAILGH
jgi:multidrug efflux pump subunit AcrB